MKKPLRYIAIALIATAASCAKEELVPEEPSGPAESVTVETPQEWHDKIRVLPYPKMSNELYVNPVPLIVPQDSADGKWLQFSLSSSESFPDGSTIVSDTLAWNMFNPHVLLENGIWYWRYRSVSEDGTPQEWSDTIAFEVTGSAVPFVTPDFSAFRQNLPHEHPRLYCWLRPYIGTAREQAEEHPEYASLLSRAGTAMSADYSALISSFSEENMETVSTYVDHLYQAYSLTEESAYSEKLHEILGILLSRGYSDAELFSSNFCSTYIAYSHLAAYDILYKSLTGAEREAVETLLMRYLSSYFRSNCGYQENHIFDNHFWQKNLRVQFQTALCLFDKAGCDDEALRALEYYYEIWTARAPASGFNRDGAWINGTGYFEANVTTLAYMPMILSYIARSDFLQHPWYREAGQALVYSWPPESASAGFGDNSEEYDTPQRHRAAFADFLARELGDSYAGWYADKCISQMRNDYELRLYRMCCTSAYDTDLPSDAPKMKWYRDIGEVVINSDLENIDNSLNVSFRSSTFGSGSHTLADQNSFNLLYRGERIYYHSGYYTSFSDAHTLLSYRHTRAHNSILVNGIGQPFSTQGYGMVVRADGGDNIAYCVGDASEAYGGISNDPMWIQNFEAAGIEQSVENGFGTTPLTKYRRHMIVLYPDILLIYDELEASEAASWDWLLHSPEQFSIDAASSGMTSEFPENNAAAAVDFFSGESLALSQTDEFFSPPVPEDPERYPVQWHLTARIEKAPAARILAVIRVGDSLGSLPEVSRSDNVITCGDWRIEAALDPSDPEHLEVRNTSGGAVYSYGYDNPVLDGQDYSRAYSLSSVLYDAEDGVFSVSEMSDCSPISTKNTTY